MQSNIIRALGVSTGFLLVPLLASFFVEGWQWSGFDYVFAWVMFSFVSLAITLVLTSNNPPLYKLAIAVTAISTFLLIWINAAVGIIGDGDINMLYLLIPLILVFGALLSRLQAQGMAYTLFGMAFTQVLIPVIAFSVLRVQFTSMRSIGELSILNGFWIVMFIVSGLLFLKVRTVFQHEVVAEGIVTGRL